MKWLGVCCAREAWLCHVSCVGGARRRGRAAAGAPVFVNRLLVLVALLLAGCGSSDRLTVALDFTPNPVHAPLYLADGIEIRKPGSGPDSLKLISSGKVELGVLDIHDLAIAREQGSDLVAVGALVGKPLAALIAQPSIDRPKTLEGKTVGVSGLPSDPAFVNAIVTGDGGDFERVKQVTIGFNAVSRLLTGRVDAVPAFWNAEGVALRERGLDANEFRVEDFGAPPYPEVVLVTSRATLEARRDDIAAALDAIARGLGATRERPDEAVRVIARAAETDDLKLIRAQLDAVLPVFADGLRLDRAVLEQWADFDVRVGLVEQRPDVDAAFDFELRR